MEAKHSPAPWRLRMEGCATSNGLPIITKANGHLVAHLCDRNAADGHLLAAAPDLLSACEELVGVVEFDYDTQFKECRPPAVVEARRAIAKAKGAQ